VAGLGKEGRDPRLKPRATASFVVVPLRSTEQWHRTKAMAKAWRLLGGLHPTLRDEIAKDGAPGVVVAGRGRIKTEADPPTGMTDRKARATAEAKQKQIPAG